jgi:hypothetical protein
MSAIGPSALRASLWAAWLAWAIWAARRLPRRALGRCRATKPASQRAAPPAWRSLSPSLEFRTRGPLPARSPVNEIGMSSSSSQQAGLRRRPPRPQRQLALGLLRCRALQVRQDLRNELRLLDAGDHLQLPAAARAALDLERLRTALRRHQIIS